MKLRGAAIFMGLIAMGQLCLGASPNCFLTGPTQANWPREIILENYLDSTFSVKVDHHVLGAFGFFLKFVLGMKASPQSLIAGGEFPSEAFRYLGIIHQLSTHDPLSPELQRAMRNSEPPPPPTPGHRRRADDPTRGEYGI